WRELADVGTVDFDAAVVYCLGDVLAHQAPQRWQRLTHPGTPGDRRQLRHLWQEAATAKETLSRHPSALIQVPIVDSEVPVTREDFAAKVRPVLARTVDEVANVIRQARV